MARKLVRDMTPEEHEEYKKELQAKKDKIRSMSPEERAEYEKKRQRKWSDQYIQRAYDTVNFRVPRNGRQLIVDFVAEQNTTLNAFLRKLVYEEMKSCGYEFDPNLIFPSAVMPEELAKEDDRDKE